jgi:hypothetical protein
MNGLLDIFGTSGTDTLGLLGMSPEAIKRSRDDAQAQALYSLAGSLLSGGPTGLSIVRGLQQGSQAYKNAMQGQLQEQFQGVQLQDALRKRRAEEQALARQQMIDRAVAGSFQHAQAASPAQFYGQETQMPLMDDEGQMMPGATAPVQARAAGLDLQSLAPMLMASREGRATLADLVNAQKAMRPEIMRVGENEQVFEVNPFTNERTQVAGLGMNVQQGRDNPFSMFSADTTIPANVRSLAKQYEKSFSLGLITPTKADERVRQLLEMAQRVQQFETTQQGLQEQRAQTNLLAQGNQEIKRMMALANLEQEQAKTLEKVTTKSDAKEQLTNTVSQLKKNYDTLLEEGGIRSTGATGVQNLGARLSSSAAGKFIGGAVGTKTQEQREAIEQTRPLLLNLIKTATGMSAQQMNSNAEMQLYLNAATNPDLSYEANMSALANLDKMFGLGNVAKEIEQGQKPSKKGASQSKSGW